MIGHEKLSTIDILLRKTAGEKSKVLLKKSIRTRAAKEIILGRIQFLLSNSKRNEREGELLIVL